MRRIMIFGAGVLVTAPMVIWGLRARSERAERTTTFEAEMHVTGSRDRQPSGGDRATGWSAIAPRRRRPVPIFVRPEPEGGGSPMGAPAPEGPVEPWKRRELANHELHRQMHLQTARDVGLPPDETLRMNEAVAKFHETRLDLLAPLNGAKPDRGTSRKLLAATKLLQRELQSGLGPHYSKLMTAIDPGD